MHPALGQWKGSEVEDIVSAFRETSERGRRVDTHPQCSVVQDKQSGTLRW